MERERERERERAKLQIVFPRKLNVNGSMVRNLFPECYKVMKNEQMEKLTVGRNRGRCPLNEEELMKNHICFTCK